MSGFHVAVVDEHEVARAGIDAWLTALTSDTRVTGFAGQRDYLDWLPTAGTLDAVITEIQEGSRAPDLDCLHQMCSGGPPVIVYSRLTSSEVILACIDAGARTYLTKSEGKNHVLVAVRRACANESYIGPAMAEALHHRNAVGRVMLSQREREVLMAWLCTETKDEVGRMLHIAPATVRTHLQRIRGKYAQTGRQAPTKSALFALAVEDGLIGLADINAGYQPTPA